MYESTEHLIERLAAEAGPVRRLAPPGRRAAIWLAAVALALAAVIAGFADFGVFGRRIQDPRLAVELIATLLTGVAAVLAAFHLSLPDRSRTWLLVPLPPLALWLASSGYGCYRHWLTFGPEGWGLGESAHCLRFILGASIPLGISLLIALRRAAPLSPLSVGAAGGLGAGAIAAFALQFFHPFDVTMIDLAVHTVAVTLVVLAALAAQRFVRTDPVVALRP